MRKMLIPTALAALVLYGCATAVSPFGKDTYVVGDNGWNQPQLMFKKANAFCADRGLVMQPKHESYGEFVFRCVPDSEATPTNWHKEADTVVVQH
jgi:putative hemolysin